MIIQLREVHIAGGIHAEFRIIDYILKAAEETTLFRA